MLKKEYDFTPLISIEERLLKQMNINNQIIKDEEADIEDQDYLPQIVEEN